MIPTYLELQDLLLFGAAILGHDPEVRDYGLLESALARPRATVFGEDAYATLDEKAAALLLSVVHNHGLVDGNKRLGWVSTAVFYEMNGRLIEAPHAEAIDLVLSIAAGELDDVAKLAETLRGWLRPLPA
ncbi:type II toxin-antitoxin system death-on-curing family toxin [Cellulomonas timonensis]|uniref:type II toxin-antitoxin system death-on-curing family toxin n=1 Tax=Cellulomonas timonensis TaxID=1689271 RepID=UPI000AEBE39A|nr:type II toxin-antitoxin system death-on-curing family toxin [Cellulomonas timonensis]